LAIKIFVLCLYIHGTVYSQTVMIFYESNFLSLGNVDFYKLHMIGFLEKTYIFLISFLNDYIILYRLYANNFKDVMNMNYGLGLLDWHFWSHVMNIWLKSTSQS